MNKKILPFVIVGTLAVVVFVWLFGGNSKPSADLNPNPNLNSELKTENIKGIKIAGKNIKVELALSEREHEQGLSGRAELKEDIGMLFVFPEPARHLFWMKDMNFAIDIVWIGEDLKIVYVEKNARPESYPETFGPDNSFGESKYVLEVTSGFSDKNNLKVGDKVEFVY